MNRVYEKPKMRFVSLQSNEKIADTCWGYHGTGTVNYFYDTEGKGYVGFKVDASSCTLNTAQLWYYDKKGDEDPEIITSGKIYDEWLLAIKNSGGNTGNPVKGHGTVFVPEKPDPGMS